jgi:HK97 family phage prohead protease
MPEVTLPVYAPDATVGEVSAKELRTIIAAVTRGAELDAVRAQVIARAEALDVGGLLPGNWRSDGTLASATATWSTDEQRETWADLFIGLEAALKEKYDAEDSYYCYVYVQDITDTEVIFVKSGEVLSAPYTVTAGGPIEIGDAVKVRPVTEYVKTERAGPLIDFRKAKAAGLKGLERRTFDVAVADMELREADDGSLRFSGYACVTGVAYDMGWYRETIERGAFKRTLEQSPDVQLLINHTGMPLARTSSGTLRLEERTTPDENGKTGLWVEADLDPEDPDVRSLRGKMARKDIDQMSFAFAPTSSGGWNDDYTERKIAAVTIHRGDVSVVNQGANPATAGAMLRSQDALVALRRLGGLDAFVACIVETGDLRRLPREERAGKKLSAATMELLTQMSTLLGTGEDAVGEARSLLDELIGTPDDDEPAEAPVERAAPIAIPDHLTRARQELAALTAGRRAA